MPREKQPEGSAFNIVLCEERKQEWIGRKREEFGKVFMVCPQNVYVLVPRTHEYIK